MIGSKDNPVIIDDRRLGYSVHIMSLMILDFILLEAASVALLCINIRQRRHGHLFWVSR